MPLAEPESPAENIAAADDQGHFHAHFEHGAQFAADRVHSFGVNAGFVFARQGLAAQFEQHALVLEWGHATALG